MSSQPCGQHYESAQTPSHKLDSEASRQRQFAQSAVGASILLLTGTSCMQLVIFLYLLDNETSTVVLISAGIGTLIEFWKVTKAMAVSIDWSKGFPLPKFEDKAGAACTSCLHVCLCTSETYSL